MYLESNPIRLVARPKLSGVGEHVGVQLPTGQVAHRTPAGNEVVSLQDFSQGRPVREVRRAQPQDHWMIIERFVASMNRRDQYRPIDNNCEHYATWLIDARPRSPQMNALGALIVGGIVISELLL